jgi:UDP-N-acetylmuramate--alanine ligase
MHFQLDQTIHIIGIGGFGMSAIARILLERGLTITGSDRNANALTQALSQDGATVHHGHDPAYVDGADVVLRSSAVPDDHVEVVAARSAGVPVYKRREILAPLMQGQRVIAVAGTHGKTTTTSMIVHILQSANLDPSYIVGGVMANTGTNAGVGQSDLFVIEADEYDDMFLGLEPETIVLTSLEYDHPDFFQTPDAMYTAFSRFLDRLPAGKGQIVACTDYDRVGPLVAEKQAPGRDLITYGLNHALTTTMQIHDLRDVDGMTAFDLHIMTGGTININAGTIQVPLPGAHNAQNAVAALVVSDLYGVLHEQATTALKSFQSTGRRFEQLGQAGDVIVINDYAHHPTAIRLTLAAARARFPDHTLWAVWQPHMYSRTQALMDDYKLAFQVEARLLVTDIYAAREAPLPGVDGTWIVSQLGYGTHTGSLSATTDYLLDQVDGPAVIVIMSAGDAPQIGRAFLARHA